MKKIIQYKYFPDAIINIGIWIFTYNMIIPPEKHEEGLLPELPSFNWEWTDYHTNGKMIGIIMITIGFTIAIRKYLSYKKG